MNETPERSVKLAKKNEKVSRLSLDNNLVQANNYYSFLLACHGRNNNSFRIRIIPSEGNQSRVLRFQ